MLKFWTDLAKESARHGQFWEFKLLNLAIDSMNIKDDGRHATVEATLEKSVTVAAHPEHNASYSATYTTRYGMSWMNAGWKIVEGTILRVAGIVEKMSMVGKFLV